MPSVFLVFISVIAISTLTRLGLMLVNGGDVAFLLWPAVLLKGLWFDTIVAATLAAPACLARALCPSPWRGTKLFRLVQVTGVWGLSAFLLFLAVLELAFWLEFSTRLNFIAVDYLLYSHEVIGNIRESYPMGLIFFAIGLGATAITWIVLAFGRRRVARVPRSRERWFLAVTALLLPCFGLGTANVDQMKGLGNAYAEELSGNGLFTFAAALRRNEIDYDTFYQTLPQKEADAVLQTLGVERVPLSSALQGDMDDPASDPMLFKRRPKNIVLISVESLSASFVGAYGGKGGWTPHLDRLAREGLMFTRFFATGTRTVRGLEALSLGTPPVPGQAIVRRPGNEHLSTLGQILKRQGTSTFFIYGGYGYFDNMNAFFNGNDYEIVDRSSFPKDSVAFENIWGVADETLFQNTVQILNRAALEKKPFFAHVMTTSNHRPFTYPKGRIDIPSPGGRAGAVKYSDFAIGQFIQQARQQPWFKETLFVITADHCASAAGKTDLPVDRYLIPLIFYGPDIVAPDVCTNIYSQIDLAPTLIEALGKRGDDHFFGRSFFEPGPPLNRTFVSNYQNLGYLRDGILTVLLPKRGVESFAVNLQTLEQSPAPVNERFVREAVAYYQTAARAFKSGALRMDVPASVRSAIARRKT